RSSNVFLRNGARLYLDVGSHPEYATAECDDLVTLIAHDKSGERILHDLVIDAEERLAEEGIGGDIYLFKNNTDSAGNSYGCHENFLVQRDGDFAALAEGLLPFLVTRQLIVGAGKVVSGPQGTATYHLSQRAEHIWEGVSSATTRSRPIINTRDEPHADAEKYRRLHVIVGDSNMSETTTLLKVGSAALVLEMIEAGRPVKDFTFENPIRAIREISEDLTGHRTVKLAAGGHVSALDVQWDYFRRAVDYVHERGSDEVTDRVLSLWERVLTGVESNDLSGVDTEIDWVIKKKLIDSYAAKHGIDLGHPRIAQIDLTYHDIRPGRGLYSLLKARGQVAQVVTDDMIEHAAKVPPETTRAKLRGAFVAAAQDAGRDYTVDWVHLKLNDQAQRTVLLKDPFASTDERVDRLIAAM
ncbi:MAG: Pup--protein ligase, partial [Nakamurella sp.]